MVTQPDATKFVEGVRRALEAMDDRLAQDRLDLQLLGVELPPEPEPTPDPDCGDCWGTGRVCACHGIARSVCRGAPEMCSCVRSRRPS